MPTFGQSDDLLVAPGAAPERPLRVSELNRAAREVLEVRFGEVWLVAEISGFRSWRSGHWYFTLKDDRAEVAAVMFRGANARCRVRPADGLKVLVRARVSLYEQRGRYQAIVSELEPAGEGALWAAYETLKKALAAEGLFEEDRERELPRLPRRIGIATSRDGAALRDVLRVLSERDARVHVVIADCRVQGEGAAEEIAAALRGLERRGGLDAIIVGRGGGLLEDLWAFNEEVVARAIAELGVPVISAVGHEVDTTIADLVADVRAATPSQAAELVSASHVEVRESLRVQVARLRQAARGIVGQARLALERAGPRRLAERVQRSVERAAQHQDHLLERLERGARSGLRDRRAELRRLRERLSPARQGETLRHRRQRLQERLAQLGTAARRDARRRRDDVTVLLRELRALSPESVLERGYAVLQRAGGEVVRDADEVEVDESLAARLGRGRLELIVTRRAPARADGGP